MSFANCILAASPMSSGGLIGTRDITDSAGMLAIERLCWILAGLVEPCGYPGSVCLAGEVACLKMRRTGVSALRNHRDAGRGQVIPSFCG
jgi:hypothetical protein